MKDHLSRTRFPVSSIFFFFCVLLIINKFACSNLLIVPLNRVPLNRVAIVHRNSHCLADGTGIGFVLAASKSRVPPVCQFHWLSPQNQSEMHHIARLSWLNSTLSCHLFYQVLPTTGERLDQPLDSPPLITPPPQPQGIRKDCPEPKLDG